MAKLPASALGVDIGRHSVKAVLLKRLGGGRLALAQFAIREFQGETLSADSLGECFKSLSAEMGLKGVRACGISISAGEGFVRIVEQQLMPPDVFRMALRLNGMSLLNQDCKDLVLDCDLVKPEDQLAVQGKEEVSKKGTVPYLVSGLPRNRVRLVHEASTKLKWPATRLQLSAVALFNGFSFANPEAFLAQGFLLVDIGYNSSTVILGVKQELILVREIEFGAAALVEELICHGASGFEEIMMDLQQEEVLTVENARMALSELIRSISSSIGFFEARREEAIPRVYVSGGLSKSATILKILTEELQLPCEAWNPFATCQIDLPAGKKAQLDQEIPSLAIAYGVASEILTKRS